MLLQFGTLLAVVTTDLYIDLTRNTCTQQPLARLPNLFSVLTVILLINMPIPFKFNSCKIYATINNAANSLGLGSQKYPKHFTPNDSHSTILIVFLLFFFFVLILKTEK